MFAPLKIHYSKEPWHYTGAELRSHYNYFECGLEGSSLFIACGPCAVRTQELVDLKDQKEGEFIHAKKMIHFLGEFFGLGLKEGVFLQCYLISVFKDLLQQEIKGPERIIQKGNDLYIGNKKLSVSVVTVSSVSLLMHFGVNIDSDGAPISAVGLKDLGILEEAVIQKFIQSFSEEWKRLTFACTKVRPVV